MRQSQLFSQDIPLRHPKSWKRLFGLLLASASTLCAILVTFYLLEPHALQVVNLRTTDIILGFQPKEKVANRVVTVDIDEQSLQEYGQWPWPRHLMARLLDNIRELKAASIGVAILFPEPDRSSPRNLQELLRNAFGLSIDISTIINSAFDPDQILADTLRKGPFVLGYSFGFGSDLLENSSCLLHPASEGGKMPSSKLAYYVAQGAICNYRPLTEAISMSGFLNGTPDSDGVLRRMPLLISYKGTLYPSLALAALQKSVNSNKLHFRQDRLGTTFLSMDSIELPVDEHANYNIGTVTQGASLSIPASEILKKSKMKEDMAGKIVIVGTTAAGLSQYWQTPSGVKMSMLDLLAMALEKMVASASVIRTRTMSFFEAGATMMLALPIAFVVATLAPLWSTLTCIVLLLSVWVVTLIIFASSGYLFSPLLPSVAIVSMIGVLHVLRFRQFQHHADEDADNAIALLKYQKDNLHSILSSIPDIIYRLDQESRITYLSPAITKYHKNPQELIGRSVFDLVAQEDWERARFKVNDRRTGKRGASNVELQLQFSSDECEEVKSRYFSVSAEGIYTDEQPTEKTFVGTQGIARDIAEKKHLERQLAQAQKMEVVGKLAAGIAHDLNNILSGVVSYPELLLMELPEDSPMREKIGIIQKSGRKAAVIVQDLLTLARRNIEISELCDMNSIVNDYLMSVEFQQAKSQYPAITVHQDLQPQLLNCRGSSVHLSKMLMNAIHNALEAMPAGGEVVVSTSMSYMSEQFIGYEPIPPGTYVTLQIKDNGVGISPSNFGVIFEPFYTKKAMNSSGTGLGMTIIWMTVKDHNGYLNIISNEGIGTTLVIYIPASLESQEQKNGKRPVLEDYVGSETILVVDDDDDQRMITGTILSKLGYDVITTASGEGGVKIIRERPVDLVILDMVMPGGMDGLDTFRMMRSYKSELKAVIISGFAESARVRTIQELGAGRFIQKPYSMEQLGMAIRAEFNRIQ